MTACRLVLAVLGAALLAPLASGQTPIEDRITIPDVPLDDGLVVDLDLRRFSIADERTRFVVGRRGGDDVELAFDPDSVRLYRGSVEGQPGSSVFLSAIGDTMAGRVRLSGAGGMPVSYAVGRTPAAGPHWHARRADFAGGPPPGVALCQTLPSPGGKAEAGGGGNAGGPPMPPAVFYSTQVVELAVETDYEFFDLFDDLDEAAAYVVQLYGAISDIFLRDTNTTLQLTFVRLWDTPDDPYNGPASLNQFVSDWNQNMDAVPRDLAQFCSGQRTLPYGGAAYLGAFCQSNGYSIVGYVLGAFPDPAIPSVHHYDINVCAHELGHNYDSQHTHFYQLDDCDQLDGPPQRGTIMSYCSQTVSGGNACTDLRFHTFTQAIMENYVQEILDEGGCLFADCNLNGVDDLEDIDGGVSADRNGNGIPDECEDCDGDGELDDAEIAGGSPDLNGNGVPDECDPDCNGNGVPDDVDIAEGTSLDVWANGVPDECESDCDGNGVADYDQIQDDMSLDVDRNATLDACQDCDGDGTPDLVALDGAAHCWVASNAGTDVRQFHPLSGVLTDGTAESLIQQGMDLVIDPAGDIYVTSAGTDSIVRFDRYGAHRGDFAGPGAGGLDAPAGLTFGPDGDLYVANRGDDSVLRFEDGSGTPLGAFVASGAGGLTDPFGLVFGPAGDLFVTSNDGRVLRFSGVDGAPLGDFVAAADNGGLTMPRGLLFKPDGRLLVASFGDNRVLEFEPDGSFVRQFNQGGTETALTLDGPWGLRLGPHGDVHVSRNLIPTGHDDDGHGEHGEHGEHVDQADLGVWDWEVLHINATRIYIFAVEDGIFLRSYVTGNDTGLWGPTGFDFMPGFGIDDDADGVPDACQGVCAADLDGSGEVDVQDLVGLITAWGPCPPGVCPADLTGDGTVGVLDLIELIVAWGPC